ncbi:MAG: hypothetical protein LQ338_003617 [Usnochroma carphineum]|nr:MAG: hypothetical protein LQ338_003617 [Usnochroma carphineum]
MSQSAKAPKRKATTLEGDNKMTLASLPPEILDHIVQQVPYRHDLSQLSLTFNTLKGVVFPRLYANLVLKVPQSWHRLRHFESLIDSAGEGLRYVRNLRIVAQTNSTGDDGLQPYGKVLEGGLCFPHPMASTHLNSLVRLLLARLPKENLLERQVPGLEQLRIDTYQHGTDWYWPNMSGLRSFSLSAESSVLECYRMPYSNTSQTLDNSLQAVLYSVENRFKDHHEQDEARPPLNGLDSFILTGLNLGLIIMPKSRYIDLSSLTSLTLESCSGLEDAFNALSNEKNQQGLPWRSELGLKSFYLRQESVTQRFRTQLLDFLSSIQALTSLSILLETNDRPGSFQEVLTTHGKSLRSLVWEERIDRREDFIPLPPVPLLSSLAQLDQIAEHCPDLIELGFPIDWRNFAIPFRSQAETKRYNRHRSGTALRRMRNLRTLNIRNMPCVNPKDTGLQLKQFLTGFANSVLETLTEARDRHGNKASGTMALETLVLGSFTYRDVRTGTGYKGQKNDLYLYRFLRPHIFNVDARYHFKGQPKPLAIFSEAGTCEKTAAAGGSVKILDPYWLG